MVAAGNAVSDRVRRAEDDHDVGVALQEIRTELARQSEQLRAILALLERPSILSRVDADDLARLLPALAGAMGDTWFTTAEAIAHGSPAVRIVTAGFTARKLGKLFRRATGQAIHGYVVERAGSEAGALLWRIRAVVP